ncbi:MAG TPA: hypothetical protein PKA53_02675 [Sphingobacterium sp.]|nr:hypothetical protein [Sphingobacterium sp.]
MRPLLLLCLVATFTVFSSCEELKEALKVDFDFEGETLHIEIDPITNTEEVQILGEENYEFDLDKIVEEYAPSFNISNIREVNLKKIEIELLNGDDDNNFQNLELIYAEVYANGMVEKIVAEKMDIPDVKTMKLTIPVKDGSVNVKDFATKQSFGYKVKAKLRKSTTKTLEAKVTADYNFVVGVEQ